MERLSDSEIEAFLASATGWSRDGDFLLMERTFDTAREAIRRFGRIADLAEGAAHHPDLTWVYNRLTVRLTTHDAGGITAKDTHLARCIGDVLE